MNAYIKITVLCIVLAFQGFVFAANTYYICAQSGDDNNNGTSSTSPFKTIEKAVGDANPGDMLILKEGKYYLDNTIEKALTIKTEGYDEGQIVNVIIDCGRKRLFNVTSGSSDVKVQGIVILNGFSDSNGGAVNVSGQNLTLDNCIFYNCSSLGNGGAVHFSGGISGVLTVSDCSFIRCRANNGGAIYSSVLSLNNIIQRNYFYSNSAMQQGGAVYFSNGKVLLYSNSFSLNSASSGGGVYLNNTVTPTEIINCTFINNQSRIKGSGVYFRTSGVGDKKVEFHNSILWGNKRNYSFQSQLCVDGNLSTARIGHCTIERGIYAIEVINSAAYDYLGTTNNNDNPQFMFNNMPYLSAISPCIDAGNDTYKDKSEAIDGVERSKNGRVDIGAYEFSPAAYNEKMRHLFSYPYIVIDRQNNANGISSPQLLYVHDVKNEIISYNNSIIADAWPGRDEWLGGYYDQVDGQKVTFDLIQGKQIGKTESESRDIAVFRMGNRRLLVEARDIETRTISDLSKLQAAISDSKDGDIIEINDNDLGYSTDLSFDLKGKSITLRSKSGIQENCVITYTGTSSLFAFTTGEGQSCILEGLWLKTSTGRLLNINKSAPLIRNCIISSSDESLNTSSYVKIDYGSPIFYNVEFTATNSSNNTLDINSSNCRIYESKFHKNKNLRIYASSSTLEIYGCQFGENIPRQISGNHLIYASASDVNLIASEFEKNSGNLIRIGEGDHLFSECIFKDNKGLAVDSEESDASLKVFNSEFRNNTNGAVRTKADFNQFVNCVFFENTAASTEGGGIYFDGSDGSYIYNCSFYGNTGKEDIGEDVFCTGGILNVRNSIFSKEGVKTSRTYFINAASNISYSCINTNDFNPYLNSRIGTFPGVLGRDNTNEDPYFRDALNGDLRLEIGSPCIDTGGNMTNQHFKDPDDTYLIYADVRGSVRPVNSGSGGAQVNNNFDMGAYEYSGYHSGLEDESFKAFTNIKIPAYSQVGAPCTITWQKPNGFAEYNGDIRITQPGKYRVNIFLVAENGFEKLFIAEKEVDAMMPAEGYYSFDDIVFNPEHTGIWKLRLELASDPYQYAESLTPCFISAATPLLATIGDPIAPPNGANASQKPTIAETYQEAFFWSDFTGKLYAVRPATAFITWKDAFGDDLPQLVTNKFHDDDAVDAYGNPKIQRYVANSTEVELIKAGRPFKDEETGLNVQPTFVEIKYTQSDAVILGNTRFYAGKEGYTVLQYGETSDYNCKPYFKVVKTVLYNSYALEIDAIIGQEIRSDQHDSDSGGNGYLFPVSEIVDRIPYDASLYDRNTRSGQLFPVNIIPDGLTDIHDFVVVWYQQGRYAGYWPYLPVKYNLKWPEDPNKIIIASQQGSGALPANYKNVTVYQQPDRDLPGFNPNEEHAAIFPANGTDGIAVFALRNDLNKIDPDETNPKDKYTSEPYVLVKYQEGTSNNWKYDVYKLELKDDENPFDIKVTAGQRISPPYPISQMIPVCPESRPVIEGDAEEWPADQDYSDFALWQDYKRGIWARCKGVGYIYWYYPMRNDFYYDDDGDGINDKSAGESLPWLSRVSTSDLTDYGTDNEELPIKVKYEVKWPDEQPDPESVPELKLGQTLIDTKDGLPDIMDQPSVWILYDQSGLENNKPAVRLYEALSSYSVELAKDKLDGVRMRHYKGKDYFEFLPYYLQDRIFYDPYEERLYFHGKLIDFSTGEPLLLPNVMSVFERNMLLMLDDVESPNELTRNAIRDLDLSQHKSDYDDAIIKLFDDSRELLGESDYTMSTPGKVLSAGDPKGTGYVTLAFSADPNLVSLPITLEVIRVVCQPYEGQIIVLESQSNIFDEKLTLRHSSDFGGYPDRDSLEFQWRYNTAVAKPAKPSGDYPSGWSDSTAISEIGQIDIKSDRTGGGIQITDGGAGDVTLFEDRWYSCRYRISGVAGCNAPLWSEWTEPQLHENWLKRVMKKVNLFDQRVKDFYENPVHSVVNMIAQIGAPFEGNVALSEDAAVLNEKGLLQIYQTLLNRAKTLSIDNDSAPDSQNAQNALLFAATRVADFYALLGNEAYVDSQDSTIGIGTDSDAYGEAASSIFCFQNQFASLLEEQLVLLRGQDINQQHPLYNRAIWNLTIGDGEVAYVLNYNITDVNGDGHVDDKDASLMYPQGHGDAWGHYLSGLKVYYDLLLNERYIWTPQTESILVGQQPVEVDYLDERKFAALAAARAKAGADIVNLTYRSYYSEDPEKQWQGYKDTVEERGWGVYEWAGRAGLAAYFDWVTANSLLHDVDPNSLHEGIQIIDRSTVVELREITNAFTSIQTQLNNADSGINPLGVAKDAIPFDINPTELVNSQNEPSGRTHFEQIYDRAIVALNNAVTTFNNANENANRLRRQEDTIERFVDDIIDQEKSYENRLIEIYGYPYPDDIGVLGTYPEGYNGPDLVHYMYVDLGSLLGIAQENAFQVTVDLTFVDVDDNGSLVKATRPVEYNISKNGFGLVKPTTWQSSRKAPGEIQNAYSDYLVTYGRFLKTVQEYDNLIEQIEDQAEMLRIQHNVNTQEILILETTLNNQMTLNQHIQQSKKKQLMYRTLGQRVKLLADAVSEGLPGTVGFIAGLANGVIADVTSGGRSAIQFAGTLGMNLLNMAADFESFNEVSIQHTKERVSLESNIQVTDLKNNLGIQHQIKQIEQLVRSITSLEYELFILEENLKQSLGKVQSTLASGLRVQEERERFRIKTAKNIQDYRYKDMAFRIFRNDALKKYRSQYDMTAQYVYLAAKAYDYETAFMESDIFSIQNTLEKIVKEQMIGTVINGVPVQGDGLSGILGEMKQNFDVVKGQFGFNNPQIETNYFSLRNECFRVLNAYEFNKNWREVLEEAYVDNLWDIPEFRRYCKPFSSEYVREPGFVIRFKTNITSRLNFFGHELGADPFYASENYATKIRSVGVWLSNYDTTSMSTTPRLYLIPVGQDFMRASNGDISDFRSWQVIEQAMPTPFPVVRSHLYKKDWIPMVDSLPDAFGGLRRHVRLRAYPDGGFNPDEMTYDSRLVGRSVWNNSWLLIIPGSSLLGDPDEGLQRFLKGPKIPGSSDRTGNGVTDIKLFFKTYSYLGY